MVTVATGYQNYQGFPQGNTPLVDENGQLTLTWAKFFIILWQRAGNSGTLQQSLYLLQDGSQIVIINAATGQATSVLGTVSSVGLQFTGGIVGVANSPVTGIGTFQLTVGGNSGGMVYFDTTTSWKSSPTLPAYQLLLGGGTGQPPAELGTLGAAGTVLHGNPSGPPSFSQVNLLTDITGALPVTNGGTGQAGGYTVATLPASAATGSRTWVTDASAATYSVGATVTAAVSGGSTIPVFYNGTSWVAG